MIFFANFVDITMLLHSELSHFWFGIMNGIQSVIVPQQHPRVSLETLGGPLAYLADPEKWPLKGCGHCGVCVCVQL